MSTWNVLNDALRDIPHLPGAKCVGRWELWDETDDPEVTEFTINMCNSCESRAACEQWFNSINPNARPVGVIAGRINRERPSRRKTA